MRQVRQLGFKEAFTFRLVQMPTLHLYHLENECLLKFPPLVPLRLTLVLALPYSRKKDQTCNDCYRSSFQVSMLNMFMYTNNIKWALSLIGIFKLIHPTPGFSWKLVGKWKIRETVSASFVRTSRSLWHLSFPKYSLLLSLSSALLLSSVTVIVINLFPPPTPLLARSKWEPFLSFLLLLEIRGMDL